MFKKVYIEITNSCNLNCKFCIHSKSKKRFMNLEEFKIILNKLNGKTKYLYLHVLGEPLLHPKINEFIKLAKENGYNINITTNGYLISNLKEEVRQINISLHSYNKDNNKKIEEYMNDIFSVVDKFKNTYISYRFWANNKESSKMLELINKHYNTNINKIENNKLKERVFISTFKEFIWPDLENSYYNEEGICYALKDHIGILSNGDIVPCCLDTKADIKLGNIYENEINEVLSSEKVKSIINGFKCNKKNEELCKHCNFLEKN